MQECTFGELFKHLYADISLQLVRECHTKLCFNEIAYLSVMCFIAYLRYNAI